MPAKSIPDGYSSVMPYLAINNAAAAIEFYKKAFGATEKMRMDQPNGKVGHAEICIGDSVIMLADATPEMDFRDPLAIGGAGSMLMAYVDDVDAVFKRALAEGAKQLMPVQNKFYGDRSGTLVDPFGHRWTLATHIEDVPPEELQRRAAEAMTQSDG